MAVEATQEIKKLSLELDRLKEAASMLRKRGKDAFIAQLRVTAIPAKLKMAEATLSQKDIETARRVIDAAKKELGANAPPDEHEEIFKNQATPLSAFQQVKSCIAQAEKAAGLGKREQAAKLYNMAREKFPLLGKEEKREAASACQKLLAQLSQR